MSHDKTLKPTRKNLQAINEALDQEIQVLLASLNQQQTEHHMLAQPSVSKDLENVQQESNKVLNIIAKKIDDFFGTFTKPKDFLLELPDSLASEQEAAEDIMKLIKEEKARLLKENERMKENIKILEEGFGTEGEESAENNDAELQELLSKLKEALFKILDEKFPDKKEGIMEILRILDGKSSGEWKSLPKVNPEIVFFLKDLEIIDMTKERGKETKFKLREDLAT